MIILYRLYQLFIVLPIGLLATLVTAIVTIVGCSLGGQRFWGYYPGKWWSWLLIRLFLLPVKVEGRENLVPGQSYVFCPNHQGAFDIFLVYGFLGRNFKWVLKQSLRKMPFVGKACEAAGFIFVDHTPSKISQCMTQALRVLKNGMSVVMFPEGRRTFTGKMGPYKRGAFMLANELQLPVVPITIMGSYEVMSRTRDFHWVIWHPLRLIIHKPLQPISKGADNIKYLEEESRRITSKGLMKTIPSLTIPTPCVEDVPQLMQQIDAEYRTVDTLNWSEQFPYLPKFEVAIVRNQDAILIHYKVTEQSIRAVARKDQDNVWEDSCVEFFSMPFSDGIYYNVECSCNGKILLAAGATREGREPAPTSVTNAIQRWSSLGSESFEERKGEVSWQVALVIPKEAYFKHKVTDLTKLDIKMNIYKCGDKLTVPHFVSLYPIETPNPNFHCPEYFQ